MPDREQGREGYGMSNTPSRDQASWDGRDRRAPQETWWAKAGTAILAAIAISVLGGALTTYVGFQLNQQRQQQGEERMGRIETHLSATDGRIQDAIRDQENGQSALERRLNAVENTNERQSDALMQIRDSLKGLTDTMVQLQRDSNTALAGIGDRLGEQRGALQLLAQKVETLGDKLTDIVNASRLQAGQAPLRPGGPPGGGS